MKVEDLAELVEDAELVANAGVRLGRIPDPLPLLNAIQTLKSEQAKGDIAPSSVINLQNELSNAVIRIFPVTLYHLKSGWRPFARAGGYFSTWSFVSFCIVMLFLTSWGTMRYERYGAQLSLAKELHGGRAQEIAFNLNAILKANNKPFVTSSSIDNLTKDAFFQQLMELYQIDKKQTSFSATKNSLDYELSNPIYLVSPKIMYFINSLFNSEGAVDYTGSYSKVLNRVEAAFANKKINSDYNASFVNGPSIVSYVDSFCSKNTDLKEGPPGTPSSGASNGANESSKEKAFCSVSRELSEITELMAIIGVNLTPRGTSNMANEIVSLQGEIVFLGSWVLPFLYGVLGSLIFHLRRFLDPTNPNPRGVTTFMRVMLGGFGGVIVVWLLNSTTQNDGSKILIPFTHFGLAFLVGFSTDLLFQFLDASVSRAQSALTSLGAGGNSSR